jgi:hypothetical protein
VSVVVEWSAVVDAALSLDPNLSTEKKHLVGRLFSFILIAHVNITRPNMGLSAVHIVMKKLVQMN